MRQMEPGREPGFDLVTTTPHSLGSATLPGAAATSRPCRPEGRMKGGCGRVLSTVRCCRDGAC